MGTTLKCFLKDAAPFAVYGDVFVVSRRSIEGGTHQERVLYLGDATEGKATTDAGVEMVVAMHVQPLVGLVREMNSLTGTFTYRVMNEAELNETLGLWGAERGNQGGLD